MPSIWPFSTASSSRTTIESQNANHAALPSTPASSPAPIPPLIICEGFLSAAQSVVWGNEFRTYLGVGHQQLVDHTTFTAASGKRKRRSELGSSRPVVFAPIGPVSSLHDRACELFYALRGGTVDYGTSHAKEHGHGRYGRYYPEPLCPGWGPDLPAHFLGHSLGGPTILKLQQLLRQGFFSAALGIKDDDKYQGWRAEDLVLSVISVSSPFRGTPLVYSLGSEPLPYPKVRMFSVGDMLSKLIHIAAYLDLPGFDAHADAWHFSGKRRKAAKRALLKDGSATQRAEDIESGNKGKEQEEEVAGVTKLLRQLWKSDWSGGKDCAPWECTFAERDRDTQADGWGLEPPQQGTRRGRTWYRSYAGAMTVPDPTSDAAAPAYHRPETYWSLSPLTLTAHLIGHFDYSRLQPLPSFLTSSGDEKTEGQESLLKKVPAGWWENDGVVPLASQFHPLDCDRERCRHFQGMPASLPHGKRRKRLQSTSEIKLMSPPHPLSPVSETATLVDVDSDPLPTAKADNTNAGDGLPLPATAPRIPNSNKSVLGSAKSAARVAYFTSLRAINLHDPPLVTPSEEELNFLFHATTPPALSTHHEEAEKESTREVEAELLELEPEPNKWYTFEVGGMDHTSLCPFWTGSEVQKQFWTGMGLFLASVDRVAGYAVVEASPVGKTILP